MKASNIGQSVSNVRHVVASFDNVERFEDAIKLLEQSGFLRAQISMIASRDTVENKLSRHYSPTGGLDAECREQPQALFTERHDIVEGPVLAIGVPVFIGGNVNGQPVVATGGALAVAALIVAEDLSEEAGIGNVLGQIIDDRRAAFIEALLAEGQLLLGFDAINAHEEEFASYLLSKTGGHNVTTHMIARDWRHDRDGLGHFSPYVLGGSSHGAPETTVQAHY